MQYMQVQERCADELYNDCDTQTPKHATGTKMLVITS